MTVLLLNATYSPVRTISTRRALALIQQGKAHAVEGVAHVYRTVTGEYTVPSVISMRYYVNAPKPRVKWSKTAVFRRDNWQCGYCGKPLTRETATIDHIVPQCRGGQNTWVNTVTACLPCNQRKNNKSLSEVGMRLRVNPQRPRTALIKLSGNVPVEWHKYIEV